MKKILGVLLLVLMGTISFTKEVLYVGTNAEFAPFEYMKDGEIVGFDIDLINKIGEKIGKEIKIKNIAFDGLLPALQTNKIDLIIAGMTVTKEREKFVDFSKDYFIANQVIVVPENENTIIDMESLKNKKVGVVLGYTGDLMVSKVDGVNKIQYNSAPSSIMALKGGKIDAMILDSAPAQSYVAKNKGLKIINIDTEVEKYAIAAGKNNQNLINEINKALDEIKSQGIYDELIIKHFN
ncbi:basic amino acid ABC transporter substrate-binding protein (plasmid) [Cetobacterium somerae]|uniref:basic amino acid ABC transporter substrate-binding protein n=1 Tax=Cetobacterium somerae TaxID=188913 RepID=UPI003D76A14D